MEGVTSVLLLASEANLDDKRRKEEDQACKPVSTRIEPRHRLLFGILNLCFVFCSDISSRQLCSMLERLFLEAHGNTKVSVNPFL